MLKYLVLLVFIVIGLLVGAYYTFSPSINLGRRFKKPVQSAIPMVNAIATSSADPNNLIGGNWSYMPGVKKTNSGLTISPTDISIVEQNGKLAQKNPPINIAGTYINQLKGDFEINISLQKLKSSAQIIQLYQTLPIIADEFLVNGKNLTLNLEANQLKVGEQTFKISRLDTDTLIVRKSGTTISFVVNNSEVGKINSQLFKGGNMWFGFDAKNSDWQLKSLAIKSLNSGSLNVVDGLNIKIQDHNINGLQKIAEKKQPDFILLDLIMPEMNGTVALQHLKSMKETAHIPVALLTVVPAGVPERISDPNLQQKIVAYWKKRAILTQRNRLHGQKIPRPTQQNLTSKMINFS